MKIYDCENQMERVYMAMKDGKSRTLQEIEILTHDSQPSISAQLRHLRKERYGSYLVFKRVAKSNASRIFDPSLFEYQLLDSNGKKLKKNSVLKV